jgi:phosphatidate cytidylyltransferase
MMMSNADPARPLPVGGAGSDLRLRIGSALVLAPLAIGVAYLGGWFFALFWAAAAIIVAYEWMTLVCGDQRRPALVVGAAAVAIAIALFVRAATSEWQTAFWVASFVVLAVGMLGAGVMAPSGRGSWVASGVPYASAMGLAPIYLRSDGEFGFIAIVFLFAVVWTTDIAAYFVGRAVGGPKLAPRVSPNKTWSGAIGGLGGGAIAALLVVSISGTSHSFTGIILVALALSVAGQGGDLFESAVKRRFGAKDAGSLIPGHGGLMDRLDGFVAAAVLACLIGLVRGGGDAPARGLLIW